MATMDKELFGALRNTALGMNSPITRINKLLTTVITGMTRLLLWINGMLSNQGDSSFSEYILYSTMAILLPTSVVVKKKEECLMKNVISRAAGFPC